MKLLYISEDSDKIRENYKSPEPSTYKKYLGKVYHFFELVQAKKIQTTKGGLNQFIDLVMNMFKKKLLAMALATSLLCASVASAETQQEKVSSNGRTVTCTLDCVFQLVAADRSTASTEWKGYKGYIVRTRLYQCQNAFSDYVKLDKCDGYASASVSGSAEGVWKFKSIHSVVNTAKSTVNNVQTLTDW